MSLFFGIANLFDAAIPSVEADDAPSFGLRRIFTNPFLIEATPSPVLWGRFHRTPERDPTPLLFQACSPPPQARNIFADRDRAQFEQYNLEQNYTSPAYATGPPATAFPDSQEWYPHAAHPEPAHFLEPSHSINNFEDRGFSTSSPTHSIHPTYPTGAPVTNFLDSQEWFPRTAQFPRPEPIHFLEFNNPVDTREYRGFPSSRSLNPIPSAGPVGAPGIDFPDSQEWWFGVPDATCPETTRDQLPHCPINTPEDLGCSSSRPIWISDSSPDTSEDCTLLYHPQLKSSITSVMETDASRSSISPEREHGTNSHPNHPLKMTGDIESAVPVPIPETTAPLSVRSDNDSISHSHTVVHHSHAESLLSHSHLSRDDEVTAQTIHPGALTVENPEDPPGSVRLGPAEFVVTLPMDSRVKDDYERVLTTAAADVREFLASFLPGSQGSLLEREYLWSKMQELAEGLNNVSTHPDLNVPLHLAGPKSNLETEASWAEYSSAKFLLLGHLINTANDHDLHLIIAVQDERKQQVVERYLRGKGFTYTRPRERMGGGLEVSLAKGALSFGVHSNENVNELLKAPSAIFAFDTAFNAKSPSVQHIRTTYTRNDGLLPIVWFLVANSCEHIQRCLPDLSETDQMRFLVLHTTRLHNEVGDLQGGAFGVRENAERILSFLSDSLVSWSLPIVEPLDFASTSEFDSSTPSSDESQFGGRKRSLPEEDIGGHASKRARVGTVGASQQTVPSLPEKDLAPVAAYAAGKDQMQPDLSEMQARLQATEKALGALQHRYESRTKELHKTRQERDRMVKTFSSLEERIEKFQGDVSKLKKERTELKRELDEARQELKTGGGTLGDLEATREEIRRLVKESAGLERKADYERNQAEYTREQYQNASNAAARAGNELRQLQSQSEILKRKADSNASKLRKINMKDDTARHIARIQEVELSLAARDDLLRRKEEELREIRKNRPSTRSTSTQPRSPKWGAGSRPTSPGVANNGNGGNGNNGLAGRGSALRFSSEVPF